MLKSFEYNNLNTQFSGKIKFHKDLNILTGRNGCGKTTILKALWYLYSGNIQELVDELSFESLIIHTFKDSFVELHKTGQILRIKSKYIDQQGTPVEIDVSHLSARGGSRDYAHNLRSLFFPTFRRLEGGFNMQRSHPQPRSVRIGDVLQRISQRLSSKRHKFIASLAAQDVDLLIKDRYLIVLDQIGKIERNQSQEILKQVSGHDSGAPQALETIRSIVEDGNEKKDTLLKPFNVLSDTLDGVLNGKSVNISDGLKLGNAEHKISSKKLSAGEKQMLSFLCYNYFYDDTVIFIDEPELSLHVDWQRQLFPILMRQETSNQFIVATHSPFIYSKYPEKEIIIDSNKGEQHGA